MLNTHAAGDAASLLSKDVTVRAASMRAAYSTGCSRRSDGSRGGSTMVITPMQRPARIASYAPVQPVADRQLTTQSQSKAAGPLTPDAVEKVGLEVGARL
jgi:hypothetical protein